MLLFIVHVIISGYLPCCPPHDKEEGGHLLGKMFGINEFRFCNWKIMIRIKHKNNYSYENIITVGVSNLEEIIVLIYFTESLMHGIAHQM